MAKRLNYDDCRGPFTVDTEAVKALVGKTLVTRDEIHLRKNSLTWRAHGEGERHLVTGVSFHEAGGYVRKGIEVSGNIQAWSFSLHFGENQLSFRSLRQMRNFLEVA